VQAGSLRKKVGKFLFILVALFVASLFFPSAREVHGLTLRLLINWRGDTAVRGWESSCLVYVMPHVGFTPEHENELRRRSTNSLSDYLLASATGEYFKLPFPSPSVCTNSVLLPWAVFRFADIAAHQMEHAGTTNETVGADFAQASGNSARVVINHAQLAWPTNGAWWLAESALAFAARNDAQALSALRIATERGSWNTASAEVFPVVAGTFEVAGFSKLDAAVEANNLATHYTARLVQGIIRRNLDRLLIDAVEQGNDAKFNELLEILVALRKVDWEDKTAEPLNVFLNSGIGNDVIDAIARSTGSLPITELARGNYDKEKKLRREVLGSFLHVHAELEIATSYLVQREMTKVGNKLRLVLRSVRNEASMKSMFGASMAGAMTAFLFACLLLSVLCEGLFALLRLKGCAVGRWPVAKGFWIMTIPVLAFAVWVMNNCFVAFGVGDHRGFGSSDFSSGFSRTMETGVLAALLCIAWFTVFLMFWRSAKGSFASWPILVVVADLYCVAVLVTAFYRNQLTELIAAG